MPQRLPVLILILLLAYAGRVIHIDQESLWVDEGFSYWAVRHDDMMGLLLRDVHPPVYFISLRGWAQVAGITELALRYFSVIPSLLSIIIVYHIAHELQYAGFARRRGTFTGTDVIPLLAALMMALADMENYIAQEARSYTWHVLWASVSMWLFLRWARHSSTEQGLALSSSNLFYQATQNLSFPFWIFSSLLLLYTHYIGICTIIVQGLYTLLFLRGRQRWQAFIALIVIGVLFIPWLIVVVSNQTDNIGTGFNVPSTLESLWNYRIHWFTQQWSLMIGLALMGLFSVTMYPPGRPDDKISDFTNAGTAAVPSTVRETTNFTLTAAPAFLMLAWFIVPIILSYILNFRVPILIDYRLTQITPAAALMVAFGLGSFRPPTRTFLIAVIVVYGVLIDDTAVKRPPWREIGQNAARYAVPGDLAMAHVTPSGDWQVMYYYERFMPNGVERRSLRQWQLEEGDTYAAGLPALLEQYPHVWFMHWSSDLSGFEALAQTGHIQTAVMTEDWLGNHLNVYRYDVVPPLDEAVTTYENGMTLRDTAFINDVLRFELWWSGDGSLSQDYTVSAFLLDSNGMLVAQNDSYPFAGQRPTTGWQPGEVIYDPHMLQLVEGLESLPPGHYTAAVKVYLWSSDGLTVILPESGEEFAAVGVIEIR